LETKMADWGLVVIWEFYALPGCETRFERVYGPEGEWAQLFKSGVGYVGSELNRDCNVPRRYVTLDFWSSRAAYDKFREANLPEYELLDQRCQPLTERETELGCLERISPHRQAALDHPA
jgi:heme-degrading monooxygenase HmoA